MKIAQVAPLIESVPPKLYGGTERMVSYLTEELVRMGHDVTLFASGDSFTTARLRPVVPVSLRFSHDCEDWIAPHIAELLQVTDESDQFDFIHFHTDYLSYLFCKELKTPHLTTLHGKLTLPELQPIYDKFHEPVVSISEAQRQPLPQANYRGTVYHGLPRELYRLDTDKKNYFAFLGRISPEKRCDRAIEIAIKTNTPLRIAAKIDKADREYFDKEIRHLLDHPLVEYCGEIGENDKQEFLGKAKALLFPIDWPEPFGLVMIEAMACGTPVIAWNMGSVPEIIGKGASGFIVNSIGEAVEAVKMLPRIDPASVRKEFEERFTSAHMAKQYLEIYEKMISEQEKINGVSGELNTISIDLVNRAKAI